MRRPRSPRGRSGGRRLGLCRYRPAPALGVTLPCDTRCDALRRSPGRARGVGHSGVHDLLPDPGRASARVPPGCRRCGARPPVPEISARRAGHAGPVAAHALASPLRPPPWSGGAHPVRTNAATTARPAATPRGRCSTSPSGSTRRGAPTRRATRSVQPRATDAGPVRRQGVTRAWPRGRRPRVADGAPRPRAVSRGRARGMEYHRSTHTVDRRALLPHRSHRPTPWSNRARNPSTRVRRHPSQLRGSVMRQCRTR